MTTLLHAEVVRAPGGTPKRWAFVLHGIFGGGKNWLSFTRKLAASRPEWGFVLPDLRGHGRSSGALAPHSLEEVAHDLRRLEERLQLGRIGAAIGHSFGGKVALVLGAVSNLEQLWILDSNPGARREHRSLETISVLEVLESLSGRWRTRAEFIRELEERDISASIAAWLAMSLLPDASGTYGLTLELPVIRALLDDYFRADLWSELARPRDATHLVVAGRSFLWTPDDLARVDSLAQATRSLRVHSFPEAGHWVHVDAHAELLALLTAEL